MLIMPTILVLWLNGAAIKSPYRDYADGRGAISMQEFDNELKCKMALEEIRKKSSYSISGICVAKR